ncbi:uncharacterized protein ELE39_002468 [Cryptosporidium sp. chipmunk genotype I]|uniref:uncharacterized protein n=1 Tax=Cryptosporidium sp. chipmunk genotype I TaxID=1280935 RepID=UPI00351A9334|nr:hypothetical protein ELE39_002468 [Cryptosporidium sp. chipmunk genotype I]
MDSNCSFLGNVLYNDSTVLKTITGKFFPLNKNRQFLDISTLKHNELAVFSEFLPSINEELASVTIKLEDTCVDFWNYSLEKSQFDLILVLDCSHNLHLFSLKSLSIPHSKNYCPYFTYKIPNSISRFPANNNIIINTHNIKENEPNIFSNQFLIKNEFSISLFKNKRIPKINYIKPYIYSKKFFNSNPIIFEKLIPEYYIAIDENTGFIIVCLSSYSFLIVPSLKTNKDGIIEQIELKIQTENLFHFDSLKYKLEGISFSKTCKNYPKIQPVVFCLFSDLKSHILGGKTFFFDWNNLLKSQVNPRDNYQKPICETDLTILLNSKSTSISPKLYQMRIFCTHIPVVHMQSIHVSVGRSGNDRSIPVFTCESACGYECSFINSGCACRFKKLLIIFNYEKSELKLILCDLGAKYLNEEILTVNLSEYYQEKIYIDLRDVVIIEEDINEQRIKFLISSKCMEMFVLNLQFKDNRMKEVDITKLQINSPGFELSDISSVCPYLYFNEECLIVKSILVSSTFGVIKKISFPNFNQEYILAPKITEILKIEKAIIIPNCFENKFILAAKRYQCYWDQIKNGYYFHYDFVLRYIFLNSLRISTINKFNTLKKGVFGIFIIPIEKNRYLVVYSKFFESQIDLLVKLESVYQNKYHLKKFKINDFLLSGHTTILCVKVCHNLILQVTESRIILYQGISEQVKAFENQDRIDHFQPNTNDLWEYPDLIMYAKMADDHHLMIITQKHKLIQLKIESFQLFHLSIKDELAYIPIISSFESKKLILNNSSHVILSMIGDSKGKIFTNLSFIQNSLKNVNFSFNLDNFVDFDAGMITSIEFDKNFHDNIYIVTSCGLLCILNLNLLAQDLFENKIQKNQNIYKRIILNLKSHLSCQEALDWKIIGVQRNYISNNHQIWKNRIILGSFSDYLYVELLETNKKVLKILQAKRLKFPTSSIITQFIENYQDNDHLYFLSLQGGEDQQVKLVNVEFNKLQSCDKVLPLKSIYYKVENMIYLKEKSWIVVNIESWSPSSRSNKFPTRMTSQLFLLDLDANLYGSKIYTINENDSISRGNFKFRIFPNNGKDSFFQVFNRSENQDFIPNTIFQLISVQSNSNENPNFHKDPFIVLGSYSFHGVESGLVYRSSSDQRKFFFLLVGKGLDTNKTLELVSTRVFSCLDISNFEENCDCLHTHLNTHSQSFDQVINFGNKLKLKVGDFSISFPGMLIHNAALQDRGKMIVFDLLESTSKLYEKQLIFHRMYFDLRTDSDSKLNQVKYADNLEYFYPSDFSILDNEMIKGKKVQIYRGLSNQISLLRSGTSLNQDSKIFIIGLEIILNYMYKRRNNEIISAFPAILTNLLFGMFDIVFSNKLKVNSTKSISSNSGTFFTRKKVNKLDRKQLKDGIKNTKISLHQISYLYSQVCSKCIKWKILMVLIVWYNLITIIMDNQDMDFVSIRRLVCPIFQDWVLELEKDVTIHFETIIDHSSLIENFFNSEYYFQKYQELVFSESEEYIF